MAKYEIRFKKSVSKDFANIPKKDTKKILERIDSLAIEPRPPSSKKLSASDLYRVRQGDYRILYDIEDEILVVSVVRVRHRRSVYK